MAIVKDFFSAFFIVCSCLIVGQISKSFMPKTEALPKDSEVILRKDFVTSKLLSY